MKNKQFTIALIAILIFVIIGYQSTIKNKDDEKAEPSPFSIQEITIDEYREKIQNNETFIVYIGRPDCATCQEFSPTIEQLKKEQQYGTLYYFNTKSIRDSSKDNESALDFYNQIREEFHFQWTPTINFYKNGTLEDSFQFLDMSYYEETDPTKQQAMLEQASKDALFFMKNFIK